MLVIQKFFETLHWCDKYQEKQIQIGNTTKTTFEWPEWKAIKERWKDELDQDKEAKYADWKDFWYFLFFQIICIHMKKEKFSYHLSFFDLKNHVSIFDHGLLHYRFIIILSWWKKFWHISFIHSVILIFSNSI